MNAQETSIVSRLKQESSHIEHPFFLMRQNFQNSVIDTEGYWSYPALLPGGGDSLLWLSLILSAVPMPEKQRTALFRPKAVVITKPAAPVLVRYENFRLGHDPFPSVDWTTPVAMFPHQSVASITYGELKEREESLLNLYPETERLFLERKELTAEFRLAYLALIHPIFLPYLRCLAADFFRALKVESTPDEQAARMGVIR
jgi:hypothetical protein